MYTVWPGHYLKMFANLSSWQLAVREDLRTLQLYFCCPTQQWKSQTNSLDSSTQQVVFLGHYRSSHGSATCQQLLTFFSKFLKGAKEGPGGNRMTEDSRGEKMPGECDTYGMGGTSTQQCQHHTGRCEHFLMGHVTTPCLQRQHFSHSNVCSKYSSIHIFYSALKA